MDLNIFKRDKEEVEYYWSLVIGKSWVDSGIWRVVDQKAEVIAHGGSFSWQEENPESLVEAADGSFSSAVAHLPDQATEPNKAVFGVAPSWTEGGSIKQEYLELLRHLSKELEITPAGFVVVPEAMVHLLKAQEGAPPNAIFIGLTEESAQLTLAEGGQVVGTVEVARSMSLSADVAEGLARFPKVTQYPTRILLYNHRTVDIEGARQNLLDADWEAAGITFLHTPKVEILPEEASVSAVSLAGASEVGQATGLADVDRQEQEEVGEESEVEAVTVAAEDLGFLQGEDIAGKQTVAQPAPPRPDVARREPIWVSVRGIFSQLPKPSLSVPWLAPVAGRLRIFILAAILLLLAGLGVFAYWYLPAAEVTVYVAPKKLEKTLNFKAKTGASGVDTASKTIPARFVEVAVATDKKQPATGTKRVGERSRGQVTVYRAGAGLTLPSGTVLSSSGGLKFTLDSEVKVASGSAGPDSLGRNAEPARLTASDIGAEYNLAAGTTFKVGTLSPDTTTASNDQAFSGGTSRDILAISAEDIEKLRQDIEGELQTQAAGKAKETLGAQEMLVESTAKVLLDKQDFSHKAGEETDTVSATAAGKVKFLVISREHLLELVSSQFGKEIPEGFSLSQQHLDLGITGAKESNLEARVAARLLPKINPGKVVGEIAGKPTEAAREYLSAIPGYTRAQISFRFKPPLGGLPHVPGNITLEIVAEQ